MSLPIIFVSKINNHSENKAKNSTMLVWDVSKDVVLPDSAPSDSDLVDKKDHGANKNLYDASINIQIDPDFPVLKIIHAV